MERLVPGVSWQDTTISGERLVPGVGFFTGESIVGGDTTLPTQTGVITASAITTTGYSLAWPAGADDTAVTGYEYQINAGSWIDVGNVLTANITGRSAGTTDTFNVRCYDAAGNRSTPALTTSVMLLSAGDTTLPTQTGAITASAITTTGYSLAWPAGADNVAVTGYEYRLNSGAWVDRGTNLGATVTGRTAGATDAVEVRCYDAAGNRSTPTLSLNVILASAADTTIPTQTGSITFSAVTTTSYTVTWPAGADNVAVASREYRINAGSWIVAGLTLSATVTGRTPGSTDTVETRVRDAAGNYSTPLLTGNVTLASAVTGTLVIPAIRDWETNNLKLGATGVTVDVYNISTGALVKRFAGQTTHATTGDITLNDALIIAATTYAVVTRFADGSKGMWDYTAS